MGFRENLKAELVYSGMPVKELASRSGVNKKTVDSYLGNRGYTPSVEAAVKIAKALGVSVEYLVTGKDDSKKLTRPSLPSDIKEIVLAIKQLGTKDRDFILKIVHLIKNR